MASLVRIAFVYFAIVFVAGFAFGTIRTLLIAPATGAVGAVLIELPFMLAISWYTSQKITPPQASTAERALIGLLAFMFLMAAEFALATTLLAQTASSYVKALTQPAGFLGLAGQMLFGLMPLLQRKA